MVVADFKINISGGSASLKYIFGVYVAEIGLKMYRAIVVLNTIIYQLNEKIDPSNL